MKKREPRDVDQFENMKQSLGMADAMVQAFQTQTNKNDKVEILKELFDKLKVKMITELSLNQIKIATKILAIARIKGIKCWEDLMNDYFELSLSNRRLSRKELLEAMKTDNEERGIVDKIRRWGRA